MAVKYGKIELPTKIKVNEATRKSTHAQFIAEPFERGFGHTIGNALRRVLLNSLESPAIISFRLEGVPHEYMAVDGIIEDMTHVVLNLKCALLRKLPSDEDPRSREPVIVSTVLDVTADQLEKNKGCYIVTLKDLFRDSEFEISNPDLPIFTVTKPMKRRIDLRVAIGRGYVSSERHSIADRVVDEIIIDSAFSPVRLVNYHVENTRVGQDTDYDRLILEVTTDGRVTPEEAMSFAAQIGILHFQVFEKLELHPISFDQGHVSLNSDLDVLMNKLSLRINEIELSVRSTNCLEGASIDTIAELVLMPESEMLKFRNFGKKSLNEIKAKLEEMGLSLGMDLSKIGITRENVKEIMNNYLSKQEGRDS